MMKKQTKLWLSLGIIAIIAIVGFSLFYTPESQTQKTLHIGTFSKAIGDAPFFVAKNKGWFDDVASKYGYNVDFTIYETLPPINEGFATGRVDFIGEAEPPAIIGYAAGIGIKVVGIQSTYTQQIVVPADSDIDSIADLRGKKIAVLSGTSSDYALPKLLNQFGISKNEVEIFDMAPPDARAAFETGQIDAWAVWPPWIEQQVVAGNGKTLSAPGTFIQVLVVGREDFMNENPEFTAELLQVVEQTKEWITQNEEEAQQIVADEVTLPLEVVKEAWKTMDLTATIGEREINDMQAKSDFLYDNGKIKKKVSATEIIDVE